MEHLSNTKGCHRSVLSKFKWIRWILKNNACIPLGVLTEFLVNPYYEPLSQLMIQQHNNACCTQQQCIVHRSYLKLQCGLCITLINS